MKIENWKLRIGLMLALLMASSCLAQVVVPHRRLNFQPAPAAGGGSTVTLDTSALGTRLVDGGDVTITITVGNNANRVIYVGSGTGVAAGGDVVIGVSSSVNGAFTEVSQATDGAWVNGQVWRLVNPTVGAHTITVDYDGANQSASMAISLYGVNQTTPNGTAATASGSGAAPSASVTLTATMMAVGFLATDSGAPGSVSVTSGTQRQEEEDVGNDTSYSLATHAGSGSTAITWATASEGFAVVVIPVNGAP